MTTESLQVLHVAHFGPCRLLPMTFVGEIKSIGRIVGLLTLIDGR